MARAISSPFCRGLAVLALILIPVWFYTTSEVSSHNETETSSTATSSPIQGGYKKRKSDYQSDPAIQASIRAHNDALEEKLMRARIPYGGIPHYIRLAEFLAKRGRLGEAEAMYRRALFDSDYEPGIAQRLAAFYADYGMYEKSLDTYMSLTRVWHKDDAAGYIQRAHFETKSLKSIYMANDTFVEALQQFPSNVLVHNDYGLFLRKYMKDTNKAEYHYQVGLQIDPNCPNIANNYALLLKNERKDYVAAEKMFRDGIERNPDFTLLRTNYAIFLETIKKDPSMARDNYEHVLKKSKRSPALAETRANYAVLLYESLQEYPEAEKQFLMAIQENRHSVFVHTSYAMFLYKVKMDIAGAEKHYEIAVKNDPLSSSAHHKYAVFLKNTRRSHTSLCEEHVRAAVRIDASKRTFWEEFMSKRDVLKPAQTNPWACFRIAEGDVAVLFGCIISSLMFSTFK